MSDLKDICKKCPHFTYCKNLCPFAQKYISKDVSYIKEQDGQISPGKKTTYLYNLNFSTEDGGSVDDLGYMATSAYLDFWQDTEADANSESLGIFIDSFINRRPLEDLETRYDKPVSEIRRLLKQHIDFLLERITELHKYKETIRAANKAKDYIDRNMQFGKSTKYYLLHYCFGLSYQDIADMHGISKSTVRIGVQRVRDWIAKGHPLFSVEDGKLKENNRRKGNHLPQQQKSQKRIKIKQLVESKHPMTAQDIANALGIDLSNNVLTMLSTMVKKGDIARAGRNQYIPA
jgi:transposase